MSGRLFVTTRRQFLSTIGAMTAMGSSSPVRHTGPQSHERDGGAAGRHPVGIAVVLMAFPGTKDVALEGMERALER